MRNSGALDGQGRFGEGRKDGREKKLNKWKRGRARQGGNSRHFGKEGDGKSKFTTFGKEGDGKTKITAFGKEEDRKNKDN